MLFNFQLFKKIYAAVLILFLIVLTGTIGFMSVEEYSFSEAFYMTIITVSTVGFSEVRELSEAGRLFTSFLIITSFGTFAFALTSITKYLVGGEYRQYFKDYRVNKEINKLEDHVIICGFGRNGRQAANTLIAHKQPFVILENTPGIIEQIRLNKELLYIEGDATSEENMIAAGVERAKALVTTLPKDSDNLFVVLTARDLSSKISIITRASKDSSDRKLRIAGANNVIMPDKIGGQHMASLVMNPDVIEFLDHISIESNHEINLEEINFDNIPEEYKFKTIRELNSTYQTGCLIIGFKSPDGDYIINPDPDTELISGSKLFVLGKPDQIKHLNTIFGVTLA
jgi:voltage-gated potassium channel